LARLVVRLLAFGAAWRARFAAVRRVLPEEVRRARGRGLPAAGGAAVRVRVVDVGVGVPAIGGVGCGTAISGSTWPSRA